jgi:hypothetical protein
MTVSQTVQKQNAKKEAAETVGAMRLRVAAEIGVLADDIAKNERAIGVKLAAVKATFPATTDGRKAFEKWAEKATARKYGMVKRWIVAAELLHRVPTFANVSTKADTCQMVSGLPDEDVALIAAKLDGKPATQAAVRKVMLQVSETAKSREKKRLERESNASKSTREKNNAAVEQLTGKWFKKYADDFSTLVVLAEEDPTEAILRALLTGASLGTKSGVALRVITQMALKYENGDHLEKDES